MSLRVYGISRINYFDNEKNEFTKYTKKNCMMNDTIIYKEESYQIYGAIYEVHKTLGPGLKEQSYQQALAIEFQHRGIPFEREKRFQLWYRGIKLDNDFVADFVCFDKIIVELKAVSEITDTHRAQVRNYLAISHCKLGLLVNFNSMYITPERIINPLM